MTKSGNTISHISARPYQLMCILCRLGAGDSIKRLRDKRLDTIFQAIRKNPRVPLRYSAYAGDKYAGKDKDSPHGVLFHMYQDETIKARHPFYWDRNQYRSGLGKLLEMVASTEGVCWHDPKAPSAWRGCPLAGRGYYKKGRERFQELAKAMLPSYNAFKTQAERDKIKTQSAAIILQSNVIRIFPNHLPYIINHAFQYECRQAVPVHHDNLWEPAEAMRRNPEIPVMLVPDHCMVCPPCGGYDEGSGLCRIHPLCLKPADKIHAMGGHVHLSVLHSLGLEYYQKIPAYRLLQLAQERLRADHIQFNYAGAPPNYPAFEKTLNDGLGFLDVFKSPKAVVRRVETLLADRRVMALLPGDERDHVAKTLALAKRYLAGGNRREAYLALTESAFAHTRKQYMERIPSGYARLPKTIKTETGTASADRVLKARRQGRGSAREKFVSSSLPYSTGFVTMINANRPAIAETGLRVGYDQNNLYVGLVCADADIRKLKTDARVGVDLKNVGRKFDRRIDDAALFVVQPDKKNGDMFLFTVNTKGVKLGERCFVRNGKKTQEWIYETAWNATTRLSAGLWSVEMRIPFSVFGVRSVRGATWKMNAHRFFRNDILDDHAWAPTTFWDMYDPRQCGRLVFG